MSIRLPLLLVACAGLGYLALGGDEPTIPPPRPHAAAAPFTTAGIASLPEPSSGPWSEQTARPLFSSDRRPPAVAPPATPRVDAEPQPPLAATGVILRSGGSIALLKLGDDRTVRVTVGEEVEGWKVVSISSEGVHLTRGRRSVTLTARVAAASGLARVE
jgi:hypothetical protein